MTLLPPRFFTKLDHNTIRCWTGLQRYEVMQNQTESTVITFRTSEIKQMTSHVHVMCMSCACHVHVPRNLSTALF
jgi:hypothetical protein